MISLNYFSGGFMVVKVTEDATFAVFFYGVQNKSYQWKIIAIIPNCPNNNEVVNKDEQRGHIRLLLVFSKPASGKVTDVNGSV